MSSNYKALTRTYRPQTFDDIVSQDHVSSTLKNAIEKNRLSHAYLFCGPRGVGKTTMARVLARTINEVAEDISGEDLNNTLNIIEIDAASNNSVDDIRTLRERVRIPPQSGNYKIYIIDEVHMLSKQAFNALLKTLEEPPAHVIFIFATTEPHRILPTILSRCQRFDFRRITVDEIVSRLRSIAQKENLVIDDRSLHIIAKKADGALRDALGILDQVIAFCGSEISADDVHQALNIVSSDRLFELTGHIFNGNTQEGMALLHRLLLAGNDIQELLGALTEHFRNLYLSRDSRNFNLIETTAEMRDRYRESAASFSDDDLMRMMHIVHEAQFTIRNAHNPRIHLEITILKLFHMTRTESLQELLQKLDLLGDGSETSQTQTSNSLEKTPAAAPGHKRPSSQTAKNLHGGDSRIVPDKPKLQTGRKIPQDEKIPQEEPGIFGKPALGRPGNHLSAVVLPKPEHAGLKNESPVSGNLALSTKPKALPKTEIEEPFDGHQHSPVSSFSELMQRWPEYLNKLQEGSSSMLYFTIQRSRPVQFDNKQLFLECSDSFTSDIIREQQRYLSNLANSVFGVPVRILSRMADQPKDATDTHDPWDHFLKLQKKDPLLKDIVELFGAELVY